MSAAEADRRGASIFEGEGGGAVAVDELMPLVYEELKALARSKLRGERSGHTLNTTALVHEAYVRLVAHKRVEWRSKSHFLAVAAEAMRRILINYAEARRSQKRGGGAEHMSLERAERGAELDGLLSYVQATDLLALNEAMDRLAMFDERGATVVQYRFFGGLSHEEIGEVLGVSPITVRRAWTVAKTWLRRELGEERAGRANTLTSAGDVGGVADGP